VASPIPDRSIFDSHAPLAKAGVAHRFYQQFASFFQDAGVAEVSKRQWVTQSYQSIE